MLSVNIPIQAGSRLFFDTDNGDILLEFRGTHVDWPDVGNRLSTFPLVADAEAFRKFAELLGDLHGLIAREVDNPSPCYSFVVYDFVEKAQRSAFFLAVPIRKGMVLMGHLGKGTIWLVDPMQASTQQPYPNSEDSQILASLISSVGDFQMFCLLLANMHGVSIKSYDMGQATGTVAFAFN